MDPSQIPPLRSGLGGPGDQDTSMDSTKRRLLATVTLMTQKAGMMAYAYCIHDSRDSVSHEDICHALKHQARTFLQTLDRPDVVEEIVELESLMYGTSDSNESSDWEDSDEELDDTAQSAIKAEKDHALETKRADATTGKCTCDDCKNIRDAVETWDQWDPKDEAEVYLKERVEIAITSTM